MSKLRVSRRDHLEANRISAEVDRGLLDHGDLVFGPDPADIETDSSAPLPRTGDLADARQRRSA